MKMEQTSTSTKTRTTSGVDCASSRWKVEHDRLSPSSCASDKTLLMRLTESGSSCPVSSDLVKVRERPPKSASNPRSVVCGATYQTGNSSPCTGANHTQNTTEQGFVSPRLEANTKRLATNTWAYNEYRPPVDSSFAGDVCDQMNHRIHTELGNVPVSTHSTSRSALILWSVVPKYDKRLDRVVNETYILLAKGRLTGITTIGGRGFSEYEIDRLIREILEELRGIIDYSNCKEVLYECAVNGPHGDNKSVRYNGCIYCFVKVDIDYMKWVKDEFPKTQSNLSVENELSYLEIFNIKDLVIDMVTPKEAEPSSAKYTPDLRGMFLSVGFDLLYGNKHNRFTESINVQVDLEVGINELPNYVSIRPYRVLLPKVYGIIHKGTDVRRETNTRTEPKYGKELTKDLYIGDQFYFETETAMVYRSGVFSKATLLG